MLLELTVEYRKQMQDFFDPCVDGTVELIVGQVDQAEKEGRWVKVSDLTYSILNTILTQNQEYYHDWGFRGISVLGE